MNLLTELSGELDSIGVIKDRKSKHHDGAATKEHKDKVYRLRLIANNFHDVMQGGSFQSAGDKNIRYPEVDVMDFEEGRANPVTINTQIQGKALAFGAPDVTWNRVPYATSVTRRAWYMKRYEEQDHNLTFRRKLLDALIGGAGNVYGGVRDGMPFLDYADDLDVTWDPVYAEPHRRRFFFYDKHMPLSEVLRNFPRIKDYVTLRDDGTGLEEVYTITCYWSKTTYAVFYRNNVLVEPKPNLYQGWLPGTRLEHYRMPSTKFADGSVEHQIGSMILSVALMRGMREIALRGASPILLLKNIAEEANIDQIIEGGEINVVRVEGTGDIEWRNGGEITKTAVDLINKVQQDLNAQSGVNDFQRSQTDVKVDFASQLAFMAQQSGVQARYTAQRFEESVKDDITLLLHIGGLYAPDERIHVEGAEVEFSPMMPLRTQLGGDGELVFKPGSMEYKSPAQALQEVGVLGNVLTMSMNLPPGIQEKFAHLALTRFDIEDADEWLEAAQEAIMAQAQAASAVQVSGQAPAGPGPQTGPASPAASQGQPVPA